MSSLELLTVQQLTTLTVSSTDEYRPRYADTSFWIALYRRNERHHETAVAIWSNNKGRPLASSVGVLSETWTLIRKRDGHSSAVQVLDAMTSSPKLEIVETGASIHEAAWEWLRKHDERVFSFVDAVSFQVMRDRQIWEALAFDGDFQAAGFVEAV